MCHRKYGCGEITGVRDGSSMQGKAFPSQVSIVMLVLQRVTDEILMLIGVQIINPMGNPVAKALSKACIRGGQFKWKCWAWKTKPSNPMSW